MRKNFDMIFWFVHTGLIICVLLDAILVWQKVRLGEKIFDIFLFFFGFLTFVFLIGFIFYWSEKLSTEKQDE